MAKDKINEATVVASSRSRSRLVKEQYNSKLKAGARHQHGTEQEKLFNEKIKRLFNLLEDNNAINTIARPNKLN
jgi:hypothetical protein